MCLVWTVVAVPTTAPGRLRRGRFQPAVARGLDGSQRPERPAIVATLANGSVPHRLIEFFPPVDRHRAPPALAVSVHRPTAENRQASADSKRHRPGVIRTGRCQGEGSGLPVPRSPVTALARSVLRHSFRTREAAMPS